MLGRGAGFKAAGVLAGEVCLFIFSFVSLTDLIFTFRLVLAKLAKNHQATQSVYIVKTVKKDNAVAFNIIDTYTDVEDPVKGCNLD